MPKTRKKAQSTIWSLIGIGVAFITIAVVLGFSTQILVQLRSGQGPLTNVSVGGQAVACTSTAPLECNITTSGITSIDTFADYLGTLALVTIASTIIGILVTYMVVKNFGKMNSGV